LERGVFSVEFSFCCEFRSLEAALLDENVPVRSVCVGCDEDWWGWNLLSGQCFLIVWNGRESHGVDREFAVLIDILLLTEEKEDAGRSKTTETDSAIVMKEFHLAMVAV